MSEESWDEIHKAHDKNQWATLLELCVQHLKQNRDHLWARIPQAIALTHLNHLEEAVTLLQETYENANASPYCKYQCQRELGQTFEEMGRFDDARRAYDEAHRLEPKSTIPIIYQGAIELRIGEFATAREWLNRALQCPEGAFEEAHFNIGSSYLAQRNYPKAIEHYQKALTLDPNYDIAWDRLADAKRALEIQQQSK